MSRPSDDLLDLVAALMPYREAGMEASPEGVVNILELLLGIAKRVIETEEIVLHAAQVLPVAAKLRVIQGGRA